MSEILGCWNCKKEGDSPEKVRTECVDDGPVVEILLCQMCLTILNYQCDSLGLSSRQRNNRIRAVYELRPKSS